MITSLPLRRGRRGLLAAAIACGATVGALLGPAGPAQAEDPVGPVASIVLSPPAVTLEVGQSQTFTVEGFNAAGESLGDVTSQVMFWSLGGEDLDVCLVTEEAQNTCTAARSGSTVMYAIFNQAGTIYAGAEIKVLGPVYEFSGLLPPVDAAPIMNIVKAGASVPLRFTLDGDYGLDVVERIGTQQVECGSAETDALEETGTTNGKGLSYDADTGAYTYLWSTAKSWKGCRNLTIVLTDGTTQTVMFKFR